MNSLIKAASSILCLSIATIFIFISSEEQAWGQKKNKQEGSGQKHIFTGPAPEHPYDIILARPTSTSVTASILAYKEMKGFISYGKEKGTLNNKTSVATFSPGMPFEFILKELNPDTRYYYRLNTSPIKSNDFTAQDELTFQTQRKTGSPFKFTVQSDSHLDQSTRPAVYERTLANCLIDNPDFHVDLGDTFMTDKYPNYKDSLPQYIAQRYYFGLIAKSAPLFLVLGNHDGERGDRYDEKSENMPAWSNLTRRKYFPNPFPDGFYTGNKSTIKPLNRLENYYSWEWGDALFIALDPFWYTQKRGGNKVDGNWVRTLGDSQYKWLEKTLADSKAAFKFVFIHHLVGGLDTSARGGSEAAVLYEWGGKSASGKDEFRSNRPDWKMPIHQLLTKYKVSAVLHGHDHFYAMQELDDIINLMVPQPGHPGYDSKLRNVEEYGYIRGKFMPPAGHIRISVSPEKAVIDYVRAYLPQSESADRKNGEIGHSFTLKPK